MKSKANEAIISNRFIFENFMIGPWGQTTNMFPEIDSFSIIQTTQKQRVERKGWLHVRQGIQDLMGG